MTVIMSNLTGQVFWLTSYNLNVLHGDQAFVYTAFSVMIISAPSLGPLFGGILTTKCFGGYDNPNAMT